MSFYPLKISERFQAPKNVGTATDANAVGISATFVCGAVMRLSLRIETKTKRICEVRFKTSGCGYSIAAAEILAQKITGEYLTELHKLDEQFLYSEVGSEAIPNIRTHCFELALETLRMAFANFRESQIEEFTGEKALICTCFGISEETIERILAENQAETVEQVGEVCNAGTGCGSCQPLIAELIDVNELDEFN